jgi:hypothetical protein
MHILNGQLMFLGACFADEVMTSSRIKQDDNMMPVQRKCTHEDLHTLRNILHGRIVDAISLGVGNLLPTLSVALLQHNAITSKVASSTIVEADVARA